VAGQRPHLGRRSGEGAHRAGRLLLDGQVRAFLDALRCHLAGATLPATAHGRPVSRTHPPNRWPTVCLASSSRSARRQTATLPIGHPRRRHGELADSGQKSINCGQIRPSHDLIQRAVQNRPNCTRSCVPNHVWRRASRSRFFLVGLNVLGHSASTPGENVNDQPDRRNQRAALLTLVLIITALVAISAAVHQSQPAYLIVDALVWLLTTGALLARYRWLGKKR
jgi:hypothetical protein